MSSTIQDFIKDNSTLIFILVIIIFICCLLWYGIRCTNSHSKRSNWWRHQTVKFRPQRAPDSPSSPINVTDVTDGQVDIAPNHPAVQPPKNHHWDTNTQPNLQELTKFINTYYDQDTTYPTEYISFILNYPNSNTILIRSNTNNEIKATMILRPITITIRRRKISCHYIDLLCIHTTLRKKGTNEKMMDKLKHILNNKPNDICIFKIDKRPLPYEPTTKIQNFILPIKQTTHLPTPNFELKTYNGEPELTNLLTMSTTSPSQLNQEFTPDEFRAYFITNLTYRVSFYELQPNTLLPNFCAVYFLNSSQGKIADIIRFQGSVTFLSKVIQKLRTLNVTYVNALESATLTPTKHLYPLNFTPSEPTYIHMYNYRVKQQITPSELTFNQP